MMEGPEKVVGLQCIDTLKTITVDSDVAKRFLNFLPDIVQMIIKLVAVINTPQFFEFVLEFGKFYCRVLNEHILIIFEAVVNRVLAEQANKSSGVDSANVRIGKCMNILRMIIEKQEYITAFSDALEEKLKPIYLFMADPTVISFDEDILIIIKGFIKKNKKVSTVQWEIYQQFPKVLEKQKHQFSNLLDTVIYFLQYGKSDMAQNPYLIEFTAKMAETALFTQHPNQTINNSEGAILFQILFQTFRGSQALDAVFTQVLERIRQRMAADFQPVHVMKHLIGIFMSAMYYNAQLTVMFLEQNGLTT